MREIVRLRVDDKAMIGLPPLEREAPRKEVHLPPMPL